jgi:N-acetylglucosaminyl-diphospho-decaprenol L-rhamnosyltransferase
MTEAMAVGDETRMDAPECDIAVVILNYRTGQLSIDAARSALDDAGDFDLRVVIVDNCSGDGSADLIEAWIEALDPSTPVTLIRAGTNGGVSAGNNIGMAAVRARYYLLLNSDAIVRPGATRRLVDALESRPDAGIAGPRLEYLDGEPQFSCFRLPSPANELIRGARTGPVTAALKRYDLPLGLDPEPGSIGWVSFAGVLLRGAMIDSVGPMDEGFFLYSEDVEFCARAGRAGWEIVHEPAAHIVHLKGGSGPAKKLAAANARVPRYVYASRTRVLYRIHGRWGLLAANLLWTLGAGVAALRWIGGKPGPFCAKREPLDIWTNFLDPLGDSGKPGG